MSRSKYTANVRPKVKSDIGFKSRANNFNSRKIFDEQGGVGRVKQKSASQLTRPVRQTGIPNRVPFTPSSRKPKGVKIDGKITTEYARNSLC